MKTRGSEETRRRLLIAGTDEFAAYGIAGARVERIAEKADCNKQAIYAYFKSKEGLFAAVYNAMVAGVVEAVPIDPGNLPGYAARLFDLYKSKPEVLRLAYWYLLEQETTSIVSEAAIQTSKDNTSVLREAQATGLVSDRFEPEHLFLMILQLSMLSLQDSERSLAKPGATSTLRSALVSAVERLVSR